MYHIFYRQLISFGRYLPSSCYLLSLFYHKLFIINFIKSCILNYQLFLCIICFRFQLYFILFYIFLSERINILQSFTSYLFTLFYFAPHKFSLFYFANLYIYIYIYFVLLYYFILLLFHFIFT